MAVLCVRINLDVEMVEGGRQGGDLGLEVEQDAVVQRAETRADLKYGRGGD